MVTCPNASFTDLAEIVSRIEPVKQVVVDGEQSTGTFVVFYSCCVSLPFSVISCSPHFLSLFLCFCLCYSLIPHPPPHSPEESDYQTDYEEEAVESALSDTELANHHSEHTEGEETVDSVSHSQA